jgi:beta-glucanase (GH16 family)
MKLRNFLLFLSSLAISCNPEEEGSLTTNNPVEPVQKTWTLIWSDEFDNSGAPDETKWDFDLGDGCPDVCNWGNNELQFYTKDLNNVRVENGNLIIEVHQESIGGKNYSSARMVSRNKGDWTYAKVEIRAKLPQGRGTWPALWMLPTDWKYGGWPMSGEIDIMEHVGYDEGTVHGTIHTEAYNHSKGTQKGGSIKVPDATTAFHVYSIEWNSSQIIFKVDDKKYFTAVNEGFNYTTWPFNQRFHLIMNVAVGGNWAGAKGIDDTIWPRQMEVDYVRIYK